LPGAQFLDLGLLLAGRSVDIAVNAIQIAALGELQARYHGQALFSALLMQPEAKILVRDFGDVGALHAKFL
jgi:hypothetical protein